MWRGTTAASRPYERTGKSCARESAEFSSLKSSKSQVRIGPSLPLNSSRRRHITLQRMTLRAATFRRMPFITLLMRPIGSAIAFLATVGATANPVPLTTGWRFTPHDAPGASRLDLDDGGWQKVTLPHDASMATIPTTGSPFDPNAKAGQDSGYLPGRTGWYRLHLPVDAAQAASTARLRFEAIYMDADVWLNGQHLAKHHYGYTAFSLDLTGKLRVGDNVVAVRFQHDDPSSRWYAGSGIIRPVTIDFSSLVSFDPDRTVVTTPEVTAARGMMVVSSQVQNRTARARAIEVALELVAGDGTTVARAVARSPIAPQGTHQARQSLTVVRPSLWSPDEPNLYTLVQRVYSEGRLEDERRLRVGMRSVAIDAQNGLRINGQKVELRGGNIHHDNYPLGAAGFPDADARKLGLLKAAGYNAVRIAHNPASQAMLDAADELGLLVVDEAFDAWTKPKRDKDYSRFFQTDWRSDIDSLVTSGRNHPSVIIWSIGNEIPEQGTAIGVDTGKTLAAYVKALDPTRPVTQAVNIDGPENAPQFAPLDIAGYNYRAHLFADDHRKFPSRVMMTTESTSKDAFAYWQPVEKMPSVIGDFVWTAFDYIGEAGIGWMGYSQDWSRLAPYPWNLADSGEIDATGRRRPAAYYREVLWRTGIDPVSAFVREPTGEADLPDRDLFKIKPPHLDWSLDDVHPSWSWPGHEGKPLSVDIYSELPEVELFLNGRSLGRRAVNEASQFKVTYDVAYAPGRLLAVGYKDGRVAGRWELRTAGSAVRAELAADRQTLAANDTDLAFVSITLVDDAGVPIYRRADDLPVQVAVSGAATLAGLGNGNPIDTASFTSGERRSFHGRVLAVVKAGPRPGPVLVTVRPEGLPAVQLRMTVHNHD